MGYIEYLAVLISPHPKETVKAIEGRHKLLNAAKRKAGIEVDGEEDAKLFHDDHRNTTFFDAIQAEGGEEAISGLKAFFGDKPEQANSVEAYSPKVDDIEFLERAIKLSAEGKNPSGQQEMDTIEF